MIGMIELLNSFEREMIGERVSASAHARVQQGLWLGSRLAHGYNGKVKASDADDPSSLHPPKAEGASPGSSAEAEHESNSAKADDLCDGSRCHQRWLPDMNIHQTIDPLEVQLVVNLYRERKESITLLSSIII